VKLVFVTKFTHSRWSEFHRYLLVINRLSFALPLWRFLVASGLQ